jgi:HK97 family phage prohead protease
MEKEIRQIHIPAQVEERGEIVGYPIVYDKDSEDMGFVERIAPGAVTEALKRSDVRGLKNHDPSLIFARQGVNLKLTEDDKGLKYVATPVDTRNYKDVADEIKSGLLTGQSFGFTVTKDEWRDLETDYPKRTITEIGEIFDVGPVTYPAYQDTTVALRSLDAAKAEVEPEEEAPQFRLPDDFCKIVTNDEEIVFHGEDRFDQAAEKLDELRASSSPTSTADADASDPDPTITEGEVEKLWNRINQTIERSEK